MAIETSEAAVRISHEVAKETPTIRAHHLIFAGWAMGYGEVGKKTGGPEGFAEHFTARVITWLNSHQPVAREYAATTVGVDKQIYKMALLGLEDFINAQPDQDFTIIEEVPDSVVCGKMGPCGGHCRKRYAELPNGRKVEQDETEVLSRFLEAVRHFGATYTEDPGMSDYVDAQPIPVRRITMKAGEIKRVLLLMSNPESGFADFFDDPFKIMDPIKK